MKTTMELPDALFIAAKKRAAEQRRSLRDLVTSGLRAELRRPASGRTRAGGPARIRWVTVVGGLPEGLDLSDREAMHDALRRRS
jgi:hypothetical protein